jgi:hypothetical protein
MRAYQVSSPHFTCLVEVDANGRICNAAPYLRRQWQGQAFAVFQFEMRKRYWDTFRVYPLSSIKER